MSDPMISPKIAETFPLPAQAALLQAVGEPLRWRILAELVKEPLMVVELAKLLRRPATLISKHLGVLRRAGAVRIGRGRLYEIPPQYVLSREERLVDFGYCVLRLGVEG